MPPRVERLARSSSAGDDDAPSARAAARRCGNGMPGAESLNFDGRRRRANARPTEPCAAGREGPESAVGRGCAAPRAHRGAAPASQNGKRCQGREGGCIQTGQRISRRVVARGLVGAADQDAHPSPAPRCACTRSRGAMPPATAEVLADADHCLALRSRAWRGSSSAIRAGSHCPGRGGSPRRCRPSLRPCA